MTYISVDVETTGLLAGADYDLLSVGAVDCDNLENQFHFVIAHTEAPGLFWDQSTKDWWNTQPEAKQRLWDQVNKPMNLGLNYQLCCLEFITWLSQFETPVFFVAWPASFDYPWVQHLFHDNEGTNPFTYRTIDVKSYACGKFNVDFNAGHDEFPEWLNEKPEFPHDALSDAIAQAKIFNKLRAL